MGYMIYQQYTTAIQERYANRNDVAEQLASARACRQWLESLDIDAKLRGALVEQIATLEEAFNDVLRSRSRG